MFESLVRFIKQNYRTARKIVEVGVGHRIDVALMVKMSIPDAEVIVTDKDESWVRSRKTKRVRALLKADESLKDEEIISRSGWLCGKLAPSQNPDLQVQKLGISLALPERLPYETERTFRLFRWLPVSLDDPEADLCERIT